jgi:hypothetical protein
MQHNKIIFFFLFSLYFTKKRMDKKKFDDQSPSIFASNFLSEAIFPPRKYEQEIEEEEDHENNKKDPLATQVWRLYTKAKDTLPNGSRLENLTWRMMAMTLNKKKKQDSPSTSTDASFSPPAPDDTVGLLSSSAPPYTQDHPMDHSVNNSMIHGSSRIFPSLYEKVLTKMIW